MKSLNTYADHRELGYCTCHCCSWCFCLALDNTSLPFLLYSFWVEFLVMISEHHIISVLCNLQVLQC